METEMWQKVSSELGNAKFDHLGHVYVVGRDSLRGKELSFRVDRMRSVALTDERFETPRGFNVQRYRRSDLYRPGPSDVTVRVRFEPAAARYVREVSPSAEIREKPKGALERTIRTDSLRWVADWVLSHGENAEIRGPAVARSEIRGVLDDWLAFYKANPK